MNILKRAFQAVLLILLLVWGCHELKPTPRIFKWEKRLFKYRLYWGDYDQIEARYEKLDRKLDDLVKRSRISEPFRVVFVVEGNHPRLQRWCRAEPDSYLAYALLGRCDLSSAWNCRGGGWGHELSPEQRAKFHYWLDIAKQHLLRSYELNPDCPFSSAEMITYCKGMCLPRSKMEKWYERSQKADPWNIYSLQCKMSYLEPWWGGSLEEMKAYAVECMASNAPSYFGAIAVESLWRDLRSHKDVLLQDPEFLRRAAYACKRHCDIEKSHKSFLWLGSYFAFHAGEYQLADEMFRKFKWNAKDPRMLDMWKSEEDFLKYRRYARKMATRDGGGA